MVVLMVAPGHRSLCGADKSAVLAERRALPSSAPRHAAARGALRSGDGQNAINDRSHPCRHHMRSVIAFLFPFSGRFQVHTGHGTLVPCAGTGYHYNPPPPPTLGPTRVEQDHGYKQDFGARHCTD